MNNTTKSRIPCHVHSDRQEFIYAFLMKYEFLEGVAYLSLLPLSSSSLFSHFSCRIYCSQPLNSFCLFSFEAEILGLGTEVQAIKSTSGIQRIHVRHEGYDSLTTSIYGKKHMGSNPVADQLDYMALQRMKPPSTSMFSESILPIPPKLRLIASMQSYAPLQNQPYHQPNIFRADNNFSEGIKLEVADFYGDGHVDVFID
ncbi:hypothetical protein M9H77_30346 [Catharanthus roseus]|uniref:Uncharacterized protein n=1 Tax=Catharanthus roseus TaxID=4058 RepID=A0ACB9ZZ21_CATRO|nr:hypothetical protein M9H77_30346 [Catharanthus roseus]